MPFEGVDIYPKERIYKDSDQVSMTALKKARNQAAKYVKKYGKIALPIFARIDDEINQRQNNTSLLEKALEMADN